MKEIIEGCFVFIGIGIMLFLFFKGCSHMLYDRDIAQEKTRQLQLQKEILIIEKRMTNE